VEVGLHARHQILGDGLVVAVAYIDLVAEDLATRRSHQADDELWLVRAEVLGVTALPERRLVDDLGPGHLGSRPLVRVRSRVFVGDGGGFHVIVVHLEPARRGVEEQELQVLGLIRRDSKPESHTE